MRIEKQIDTLVMTSELLLTDLWNLIEKMRKESNDIDTIHKLEDIYEETVNTDLSTNETAEEVRRKLAQLSVQLKAARSERPIYTFVNKMGSLITDDRYFKNEEEAVSYAKSSKSVMKVFYNLQEALDYIYFGSDDHA